MKLRRESRGAGPVPSAWSWRPPSWRTRSTMRPGPARLETLRKLIADGTDVNARTADGGTPLHDAAMWGHRDIAELLLSKGADVNAKDGNGMTPLHIAANGDHAKLAALLIAKGRGGRFEGRERLDAAARGGMSGATRTWPGS